MKLFISFSSQQEKLLTFHYVPQGNQRLEYGETAYPILPVINGYTEPGEEIRMVLIVQDYEFCHKNAAVFQTAFEALCAEKQLVCKGIEKIIIPFDDAVSTHIATFQKLIDAIHDGDDIHACITYGSKPAPMAELMALRYARQIKKDTFISCIAYGQVNFKTKEAKLYDETALAHLDDIVRMLAEQNDPDPKRTLDRLIAI